MEVLNWFFLNPLLLLLWLQIHDHIPQICLFLLLLCELLFSLPSPGEFCLYFVTTSNLGWLIAVVAVVAVPTVNDAGATREVVVDVLVSSFTRFRDRRCLRNKIIKAVQHKSFPTYHILKHHIVIWISLRKASSFITCQLLPFRLIIVLARLAPASINAFENLGLQ